MRSFSGVGSLALLVSAVPACLLYTDPINSPPEVTIVPPMMAVYPNQQVNLEARYRDPDGDEVTLHWQSLPKPCSGPARPTAGDWAASAPTVNQRFLVALGHVSVCVRVVGQDEHGARAAPQELELSPTNRAPALTLSVAPLPNGSVPLYSDVRVEAGPDRDEDGDHLTFTWKALDPAGAPVKLADCEGGGDPLRVRCFPAERPGTYLITVEGFDGVEGSKPETKTVSVPVLPDQPPCIESSDPSADTGVVVLAATDPPRRFEVRRVKDDGHPFPAGGRGTATFQWFTAREGSAGWTRELGYDRPTFDVSASRFDDARPGSVHRVRVEVRDPDRELAAAQRELEVACEDRAICKLPDTCVRWMTWSVRFR